VKIEEAILTIKSYGGLFPSSEQEALNVAIEALEKQQEMIEHCDCGCYECPYYNSAINGGCMNDFIIEQE